MKEPSTPQEIARYQELVNTIQSSQAEVKAYLASRSLEELRQDTKLWPLLKRIWPELSLSEAANPHN